METVNRLEARCEELESEVRAVNIQANTLAKLNEKAWKEVNRLRRLLADNGIKDKHRED
jgi:uncharacterized coiled-coil protein SlyX